VVIPLLHTLSQHRSKGHTNHQTLHLAVSPDSFPRRQMPPHLDVLNTRASVISSKLQMATEKYCELFADFIKLFKESGDGYDHSYLDGDQPR
jgi:hypothetical protein